LIVRRRCGYPNRDPKARPALGGPLVWEAHRVPISEQNSEGVDACF